MPDRSTPPAPGALPRPDAADSELVVSDPSTADDLPSERAAFAAEAASGPDDRPKPPARAHQERSLTVEIRMEPPVLNQHAAAALMRILRRASAEASAAGPAPDDPPDITLGAPAPQV